MAHEGVGLSKKIRNWVQAEINHIWFQTEVLDTGPGAITIMLDGRERNIPVSRGLSAKTGDMVSCMRFGRSAVALHTFSHMGVEEDEGLYIPWHQDLGSSEAFGDGAIVMENGFRQAFGTEAKATGGGATAVGGRADAAGDLSVAVGYHAETPEDQSVAVGYDADALNLYTVALGYGSRATGDGATAIGRNTEAGGLRSIAIGFNAQHSEADTALINTKRLKVIPTTAGGDSALYLQDANGVERSVIFDTTGFPLFSGKYRNARQNIASGGATSFSTAGVRTHCTVDVSLESGVNYTVVVSGIIECFATTNPATMKVGFLHSGVSVVSPTWTVEQGVDGPKKWIAEFSATGIGANESFALQTTWVSGGVSVVSTEAHVIATPV